MVDLVGQYQKIKTEIDAALLKVIERAAFIQGEEVKTFEKTLAEYLRAERVISCANGTDALQIALMALGLKEGDEVIVPSFTYVATAEVIGLLGLTPVMVDVDPDTFNVTAEIIEPAITSKTKAIVPVHLFGQCADMDAIMELAANHDLKVVEDAAQTLGAEYTTADGRIMRAGTIGHIGTTSFFPSKNLGCFGDGGAIITNEKELAADIKMISNHGQREKYFHEVLGVNSRLDTLQAAILNVKLQHLESYAKSRNFVASYYDAAIADIKWLQTPFRAKNSTHVFHQYTLRILDGRRDMLQKVLKENGIPSMIYYPLPLFEQNAFKKIGKCIGDLNVTRALCKEVLSLPIHTEMNEEQLSFIVSVIRNF